MFRRSRRAAALVSAAALLAGACCLTFAQDAAKDKPAVEPTAEQLEAARKAFAARGAKYSTFLHPLTKKAMHVFSMPPKTTDADLKGLPNPRFSFGLRFFYPKVTDAGLPHLRELKGLTSLYLTETKVTAAGKAELRKALPKCKIY